MMRAIGFDLDDTLYVQSDEIRKAIRDYIVSNAAAKLNIPLDDFSQSYSNAYELIGSARRSLELLGVEHASSIVQEALECADIASALSVDSRLCSMIDRLGKQYSLFLITGSSYDATVKKLEALGLSEDLFNPLITAREAQYRREDCTAFHYVSKHLGIPIKDILYVGDREKVDVIPLAQIGGQTAFMRGSSPFATFELKEIYDLEEALRS